eukprot:COSAG02_NODE_37897_length_436_cov_0.709199_2_plen_23_part_01
MRTKQCHLEKAQWYMIVCIYAET